MKAELGCHVYGFASIFEAARDELLPPPKSDRKLQSYLEEHLYAEGEILSQPHALQVLTDDDEIELAYYVFDDRFLRKHPGMAACLLHEDCRLPTTSGDEPYRPRIETETVEPAGMGACETYLAFLPFYDSGGLTDLDEFGGPRRITGVRVPQLTAYLAATVPGQSWPFELKLLRSQVNLDDPTEVGLRAGLERAARLPVLRLSDAVSDAALSAASVEQARTQVEEAVKALMRVSDHDASKSLVETSDHLAQLCLHIGDWFGKDVYHQWVIFDLCAGEHRNLAEGILRYARR